MQKVNKTKIWITAIIFTACLYWLEAYFGKMIVGWVGIDISLLQALVITTIINFFIGFFNIFKYGKKKTT